MRWRDTIDGHLADLARAVEAAQPRCVGIFKYNAHSALACAMSLVERTPEISAAHVELKEALDRFAHALEAGEAEAQQAASAAVEAFAAAMRKGRPNAYAKALGLT